VTRSVDEVLEAQLAYLRSDEKLLEEARLARGMTPEERLRIAYDLCRVAAEMLDRLPPDVVERFYASREPIPADAPAVLRRLGQGGA
jgi:hypothetical protein